MIKQQHLKSSRTRRERVRKVCTRLWQSGKIESDEKVGGTSRSLSVGWRSKTQKKTSERAEEKNSPRSKLYACEEKGKEK